MVLKEEDGARIGVNRLKVDGAWRKESWDGAVAWVDAAKKNDGGSCKVVASSALMTEALAILRRLIGLRARATDMWKFALIAYSLLKVYCI